MIEKERTNWRNPFKFAPILLIIICVLTLLSHFLPLENNSIVKNCLIMMGLQIFIFMVPIIMYITVRGFNSFGVIFSDRLNMKSIPILAFAILTIIFQSSVLKFGVFYFGYKVDAYSLYGGSFDVSANTTMELLMIVLCYAIIPAVFEEIVFRGIIIREYRLSGFFMASIVSSFLFSAVHFDLAQFVIYFFAGIVLSMVVFVTGSPSAAIIVHIAYNLYIIFVEKYIWLMTTSPDSSLLFWLIMISIFLISAFFFTFFSYRELMGAHNQRIYPSGKEGVGKIYLLKKTFSSTPMIIFLSLFLIISIVYLFV